MSSATQHSNAAKLINAVSAPLSKTNNKEFIKPVEILKTKVLKIQESDLDRLLASCCDCV
jgi:hypothetical protein